MGTSSPNIAHDALPASRSIQYWYENIAHNGTSPFIPNGTMWKVYRNVVSDYGADPQGLESSQRAFQTAINDGAPTWFHRDTNSLGTTGQPVVIYVPPGNYVFDSPIQLYVGTILMGNPLSVPVLKARHDFRGDTLVYGKDPHQESTCNFYITIKNVQLDSSDLDPARKFTLLDWSVSQATQITNVVFSMPNYSTGHTGMAMPEGGSGCYMGDLTFNGGFIGLDMGSQQYEVKTASFNRCTTGILISSCFACVLINVNFESNAIGIDMSRDRCFSVTLVDSTAKKTGTAVKIGNTARGDQSLVIENFEAGIQLGSVVATDEKVILSGSIHCTWVYGNVHTSQGLASGAGKTGETYHIPRSPLLLSNGKYVTISPPTYWEYHLSQIVNVKSVKEYPVHGDGKTDDTGNLGIIIRQHAGRKVLFFPHGTYIVTDTLSFPVGSRVIGEAWSTISATGARFSDSQAPTPMVRVGNPGDIGVAQFSDMLFTVADFLPGCILVEVNVAGNTPGDVAFWNTHFRVGGAAGSRVQTHCGNDPESCKAAFLLLHLASTSSTYIENMWLWTADHDLDSGNNQRNIATGRGMLVEATAGTWLHGSASEHNVLYQYHFHKAQNVFVGLQQGEAPYWQGIGSPKLAPGPWDPLSSYADPTFSNAPTGDASSRMAWYNIIDSSSNMFLYGSGFWTFFSHHENVSQNSHCQANACLISGKTSNLYWFSLNTKSVLTMIQDYSSGVSITQNDSPGSWGGNVAAYLMTASPMWDCSPKKERGLASKFKDFAKKRLL